MKTQLPVYPSWGSSHWLGSARVWGILVAPGAGRRGELPLAVTQIDSGLARELGVCRKLGSGSEQQQCPKRLFKKGELRHCAGTLRVQQPANKEGGVWAQFATTK